MVKAFYEKLIVVFLESFLKEVKNITKMRNQILIFEDLLIALQSHFVTQ